MGFLDKLKNKAQQARGRGKERAGYESGNPRMEAEGRQDRTAGGAKQVGEHAKDAAKDVKKTFRR